MIIAITGCLEDSHGKVCPRCSVPKPLADYRKDKTRPDGRGSWCRSCCREYEKQLYARDPEKYKQAVAARKAADPEKVRARDRSYNQRHAATHRARSSLWSKSNPERRKVIRQRWEQNNKVYACLKAGRRRALVLSRQVGAVTPEGVAQRVEMYGGMCAYCGGPYEHLDHVKPLNRGGPHMLGNLRPSCSKCNQEKGARSAKDWFQMLKERNNDRSA
jgi:5-methylcytosine-specific restriction endonuclease McrA